MGPAGPPTSLRYLDPHGYLPRLFMPFRISDKVLVAELAEGRAAALDVAVVAEGSQTGHGLLHLQDDGSLLHNAVGLSIFIHPGRGGHS